MFPRRFKTATFTADGQTLTIQTVDPSPTMIYDLTDPFYCIMDVHSGTDFATNPIGTGPYIVDSFTAKSSCTLHANENYWGGEPKIQTVEYRVIMDTDTMSMAIQNGEIDWATGVSAGKRPPSLRITRITMCMRNPPAGCSSCIST